MTNPPASILAMAAQAAEASRRCQEAKVEAAREPWLAGATPQLAQHLASLLGLPVDHPSIQDMVWTIVPSPETTYFFTSEGKGPAAPTVESALEGTLIRAIPTYALGVGMMGPIAEVEFSAVVRRGFASEAVRFTSLSTLGEALNASRAFNG